MLSLILILLTAMVLILLATLALVAWSIHWQPTVNDFRTELADLAEAIGWLWVR